MIYLIEEDSKFDLAILVELQFRWTRKYALILSALIKKKRNC